MNLGADTTGSNLKNTYGEVRVPLDAEEAPQPTGTNKFGAIIGDHVRTAIGTRLTTGSCIGTGSMVALSSFAPAHVPRFSFWTDRGRDHCDFERFLATSERMMARRNQVLTEAERARLRTLSTRVRSNK